MTTPGAIIFAIGALITLFNFYLSYLRYPVHIAAGGTRETYRWVSGVPLLGSFLLWLSVPLLPSVIFKVVAILLSLLDTGGIHWFLGTMWWTGQLGAFIRGREGGA